MIFPRETLKKACSVCAGFGGLLRARRGLSALCHAGLRGDRGVRAAAARSVLAENGTSVPGARGGARRLGAGRLRAPGHFLRARPGVLRDGGGRQCPRGQRARARAEGPDPGGGTPTWCAPQTEIPLRAPAQERAQRASLSPRCDRGHGGGARTPRSPCPRARPRPARTARGALGVARAVPCLSLTVEDKVLVFWQKREESAELQD